MADKIAIIGAGFVGSTAAYAMLIKRTAEEIVLIDVNREKAEGEAMDLNHGMQLVEGQGVRVSFSERISACKGARVVIVTAGKNQEKGESRLELTKRNAAIFRSIIPEIVKHNKDAVILVVTNPVDVLTTLAVRIARLPKGRVFGSGTLLDSSRFRYYLGEMLGVNPSSVHAYILGEHGDSSFPVWSSANISGIPLKGHAQWDARKAEHAYRKTRDSAYEIISRKGATYYAIGLCIADIVHCILSDARKVFPVSSMLENYEGVSGVCVSVPCIVGKNGVERQLKIELDAKEKAALKKSAAIVREAARESE